MLSICGCIYLNQNIVPFARSVLENANDPDNIEFSVVEDEAGSDLMASCFETIKTMTKRLKVIQVSKEERLAHFERCIGFYEREEIFPPERIEEFRRRVEFYGSGQIQRIWFHPSWLYDRAVEASEGDVVLVTPLDLLVTFSLSEAYKRFKEGMGQRKYLCLLFGLREGNRVRQHGIKIFNKDLFYALRIKDPKFSAEPMSFDGRWLSPAFTEDDFNLRAQKAGGECVGWEEFFGEPRVLLMPDSPWFPEYICNDMGRDHPYFLDCIMRYLARPVLT